MNFENEQDNQDNSYIEIDEVQSLSIEDFIKELEAKEKDLRIPSDLSIEIDDADFDDTNTPDFVKAELAIEPVKPVEKPKPAPPVVDDKKVKELEEKLSRVTQQITKLETERGDLHETMRRRQGDFDNYRKRTERERSETFVNQISNLAKQMLPVLDNLNRALDFAAANGENRSQDFHQFFEGIVLVNQQLNEVLAEMGISPIASVGEHFDPHYHEAVATETSGNFAPNTVTGELLRGYRIGNKVIRPAMVKVAIAGVSPNAGLPYSTGETNPEAFTPESE